MGTKEILQRRQDIPDDQVEELVARAAKLQDDAMAAREDKASSSDIQAVAAELDIEPQFVEQAIASWRLEQDSSESAGRHTRILERRKRTLRIVGGIALIGLLGAGLTVLTAFSAFGWQGIVASAIAGVGLVWFLLALIT